MVSRINAHMDLRQIRTPLRVKKIKLFPWSILNNEKMTKSILNFSSIMITRPVIGANGRITFYLGIFRCNELFLWVIGILVNTYFEEK